MAALAKGTRITGPQRAALAEKLKAQYLKGKGIRDLAATHGRSYGFVHRVLVESGVELRGRGGSRRTSRRTKTA